MTNDKRLLNKIYDQKILYFLRCLECKSFTEAACSIGISRSALSLSISKLEEGLGHKLFRRDKKGINLTAYGSSLAGSLLSIKSDLTQSMNTSNAAFKIGLVVPFGLNEFLPVYYKFKNQLPKLQLFFAWSTECLQAIRERKIDVAFISWSKRPPKELEYKIIRKDRSAIIGLKSKFSYIENYTQFDEVRDLEWITHSMPQESWTDLISPSQSGYVIRDFSALKHLILNGNGIGEMQLCHFSSEEISKLSISKIPPRFPGICIYAVYSRDASSEIISLVEFLSTELVRDIPHHVLPTL